MNAGNGVKSKRTYCQLLQLTSLFLQFATLVFSSFGTNNCNDTFLCNESVKNQCNCLCANIKKNVCGELKARFQ